MSDEQLSHMFAQFLQTSADGFVWGVEQVPSERRAIQPLKPFGEWPVARHVLHMGYYERQIALPSMRQWIGEPLPDLAGYDEDQAWEAVREQDLADLLAEFRAVRAEQVALARRFDEGRWAEQQETVWGRVSLRWVVSKTYQHTAEHTHDVLSIALFWDFYLARQQRDEAATASN